MNYTWSITSVQKADTGDLSGVIIQTRWSCTGTDENGHTGTFHGATPFDINAVDPTNFTPFDELTEQQVLSWIQGVVIGTYWEHVEQQIAKQVLASKAVISEVTQNELPWAPASQPEEPTKVGKA